MQSTPMASRLQACKVYISEGRRPAVIKLLKVRELMPSFELTMLNRDPKEMTCQEAVSSVQGARVADVFADEPYNRSNFILVSEISSQLEAAAVKLSSTALQEIDFQQHQASHPRVGIVDHISCQPVGPDATLREAAKIAKSIGSELGRYLPVFLYGAAHPQQHSLADIRRRLGYFKGASQGLWAASEGIKLSSAPDFGPKLMDPCHGIAAVGATGWVTNLNIPLATDDMATARQIARQVSSRGGGMSAVEAMALPHTQGVEVACNLLDTSVSSVDAVTARVQQLAQEAGISSSPAKPYVLGVTREQLLEATSIA